jgi:hypothetical protein
LAWSLVLCTLVTMFISWAAVGALWGIEHMMRVLVENSIKREDRERSPCDDY